MNSGKPAMVELYVVRLMTNLVMQYGNKSLYSLTENVNAFYCYSNAVLVKFEDTWCTFLSQPNVLACYYNVGMCILQSG